MTMNKIRNSIEMLKPVDFLGAENSGGKQCLEALKQLYDLVKSQEKQVGLDFGQQQQRLKAKLKKKRKRFSKTEAPLAALVTQNFDGEQVWQELQLQNNFLYDDLVSSVSTLAALKKRLQTEDDESDEPMSDADRQDKPSSNKNDEELPHVHLNDALELESEGPDSGDEKKLSNFERRAKNAEKMIQDVEDEALQPKSWQLTGETTASTRPENALLEEHLMFDHLIRQAPLITAETTLKLEDIIKQRIKDQVWDDVERKIRPTDGRMEFKKAVPLNAEKSKESLAEIYEKEALTKIKPAEEPSVPEYQVQVQKELDDLFVKLDALSNFHYTPVNPTAEIRVVNNLPSIAMEEATPVTMTDATMLAPAELERKQTRSLKSKEEMTDTDKKHKRRAIKKMQKIKRLDQVAKGLAAPNIKQLKPGESVGGKKAKSEGGKGVASISSYDNSKHLKSSQAFFAKLQAQVQSQVKSYTKQKQEAKTKKATPIKL